HHPRLTFEVTQAHTGAALYCELRERNVDLIVGRMTLPIEEDDLNADGLFDDPQFVVAGSRNRWLRRRDIELAELMDEPWILPQTGTVARTVIAETFAACGCQFRVPTWSQVLSHCTAPCSRTDVCWRSGRRPYCGSAPRILRSRSCQSSCPL